jgi:broad specificity phosphatase PhoE
MKPQVFLIRHANSAWNAASEANKLNFQNGLIDEDRYRSGIKEVFGDPDLCDCPLSADGVQQCAEMNCENLMPNLTCVILSPLRRTLETAYRIFHNHRNFENIKFMLHPLLREQLHCSCDIPADINLVLKDFQPRFPHLDTSLMPRIDG